ncbi:MAG: hypothetical protein V1682_03395 [Candidatus Omnitrophota bacterium]
MMSGLREKPGKMIRQPSLRGPKPEATPILVSAILLLLLTPASPGISFGAGLEVGPGDIYVENVSPGEPVAVSALGGEKMKLNIKNKGAEAYTYSIDILPSARTTAALKEGYEDIPDVSWIFPEVKEIQISGNSSKDVELYIKIPGKKEFYGKKYQAVVEVKSKKNKPEEIFVLACQLKMLFTTDAGGEDENK